MKKKIFAVVMACMMLFVFTACGSSDAGGTGPDRSVESSEEVYEEEQGEEDAPQKAVKARIELDEYQIGLDEAEDTTVSGTIDKSCGQDIVALAGGEEGARVTLKGNNGEEEHFSIVIPAEAISRLADNDTYHSAAIQIKGDELPGYVNETYTKTVNIGLHDEE